MDGDAGRLSQQVLHPFRPQVQPRQRDEDGDGDEQGGLAPAVARDRQGRRQLGQRRHRQRTRMAARREHDGRGDDDLEFLTFDPGVYEKEIQSSDIYIQRRAKLMLEAYNKGWDISRLPYPVQAVRFGKDLTILALGGEVVSDYSLSVKKKFAGENLFVAGYCNEVQCYIPSQKILAEGGYEPESSMIYYGLPGPFADNVETKINKTIDRVLKRTGARPSKR